MTILVTGATGNTGRHVVSELLKRGRSVRALTRDPAKAVVPAGAEVVGGDHNAPSTLDAALDGVTGLHITVTKGVAESGPALVRRAVAAGVERITILWGGYVGPAEQAVAESGVEWTRLEPEEFMSNALDWRADIAGGVVRAPFASVRSAVVHEGDIGEIAAVALTEDGHDGLAYSINGPEPLTAPERAAILAGALGRELRYVETTRQDALDRLLAQGVSQADADYVVGWHESPPVSAYTPNDIIATVLGRAPRTFAQWAAENAGRF
ncbi:nucleotide-diphosphate-sugar epimerase [Actinorhabdospora filicis]|uniref:Nucleotide-diphosphate-sugar epimerase n=1 Tax=Actinorhabdospora filicis TaxID=1785913 RepID=A0A9W6W9D5_9ACTN|nr:NmrA family NAD(P)-binding protein [Actinorhabdospora filicis]GLZ78499.1 nucleotide-diphosphate-sugar epimerase [Actinorhabdospora filicis]